MSEKQTTRPALVTRRELAKRLNANPRSVSRWLEEGCPVVDRGKGGHAALFNEGAVRAWLQARETTPASGLRSARERRELAMAAESEQRVALRAGKLIAIEDVERTWSTIVSAVRAKLLTLPVALADRVHRAALTSGAAGVESILHAAVYDCLRELAEDKPAPKRRKARKPTKRGRRMGRRTS